MTESTGSAGQMLREARQAQNLEIDDLASLIKVAPAKLEALESGRHDLLPDANFTRALAMTVCRSLKIDPAPVLAALPAAQAIPLSPHKPALNQPFKESRGANLSFDSGQSFDLKALLKPQWLAPIFLLLASLAIYFLPDSVQWPHWAVPEAEKAQMVAPAVVASAPEVPASAAEAVSSAPEIVPSQADPATSSATDSEASQAAVAQVPASSAVPLGAAQGSLVLKSTQPAWVEIRDAKSVLLSRHLQEGETVALEGTPPFRLRLGNSSALAVIYQGQPVELASYTRNNVARLELK